MTQNPDGGEGGRIKCGKRGRKGVGDRLRGRKMESDSKKKESETEEREETMEERNTALQPK